MDHYTILDNIEACDLRATDYRAARRLLDLASNHWTVYLSQEEACALCDVRSWGGAKRILRRIADAGVMQLHTNNCAYITLMDRVEADPERAEMARERADSDPQRAESARQEDADPRQNGSPARRIGAYRAILARERADSARSLIGIGSRKDLGRKEDTYLPKPNEGGMGGTSPPSEEATRSVGLLVDVGVTEALAIGLAKKFPFEEVRRQVFQYLRDSQSRKDSKPQGPGVIPGRLNRHHPAKICNDDLDTDLWERHMTEDETYQERRRLWIPDEYSDIIMG